MANDHDPWANPNEKKGTNKTKVLRRVLGCWVGWFPPSLLLLGWWLPSFGGGLPGVMTHPGRMMSHQSANPILLLCTGVLLRCTELRAGLH